MKLRTKLILAFVILAVAPLAGIIAYSYATSQRAFRASVESDAQVLSQEMVERFAAIQADLEACLVDLESKGLKEISGTGADLAEIYLAFMDSVSGLQTEVESFDIQLISAAGAGISGETRATDGFLIFPSRALAKALEKMERLREQGIVEPGLTEEDAQAMIGQVVRQYEQLDAEERSALAKQEELTRRLLGSDLGIPLFDDSVEIGRLRARIEPRELLRKVLDDTQRRHGEVPFAIDGQGEVHFAKSEGRDELDAASLLEGLTEDGFAAEHWIIARTRDTRSGLVLGIARPIREALESERSAALESFSRGLLMVAVAIIGILWIATRLTRNLTLLTLGAERVASGDLTARVPVRSNDELGLLAQAFNRMAESLSEHNRRIFMEERLRQAQEIEQRLVQAEHARKTQELEDARELQLSLLPKDIPDHPDIEVAVFMKTATEVGGDYYDFFVKNDGALVVAIGDATGHGAKAGIMVTFIKGLFASGAGLANPAEFLGKATREVRRLQLSRLHMALTLLRIEGRKLQISAAAMPPALLARANGEIEEIEMGSMPLGGLSRFSYENHDRTLESGDCILLMTDGLPELMDPQGKVFGYPKTCSLLAQVARQKPEGIVSELAHAAAEWRAGASLDDDMTFIVLKVR